VHVRDEGSVATMAAQAQALGPVQAVVANAGVAGPTRPLHELTLEDWRDTLATDLDGVFLTFRAFIPAMIERWGGSLIAISSMTGKRPLHGRTPYAAAKMGVIGLSARSPPNSGRTTSGSTRSARAPWPARG
jgi:NAD(P)-dependent dehydrogenase (short-subunit alcohol dehydrogenase family)